MQLARASPSNSHLKPPVSLPPARASWTPAAPVTSPAAPPIVGASRRGHAAAGDHPGCAVTAHGNGGAGCAAAAAGVAAELRALRFLQRVQVLQQLLQPLVTEALLLHAGSGSHQPLCLCQPAGQGLRMCIAAPAATSGRLAARPPVPQTAKRDAAPRMHSRLAAEGGGGGGMQDLDWATA